VFRLTGVREKEIPFDGAGDHVSIEEQGRPQVYDHGIGFYSDSSTIPFRWLALGEHSLGRRHSVLTDTRSPFNFFMYRLSVLVERF
jgi:hypothetical protein